MRKIAIMMRIGLNAEALNNEGNVGNVLQPRRVKLLDGTIRDEISGEMLKHYHTRNLRLLAEDNELCDGCKILSPMKNAELKEKDETLSESGNRVKACIVDDCQGFMNAGKGRNEKRVSCIKFSKAIGINESDVETQLHTRVEVLADENKKTKNEKKQNNEDTTNDGNTIKEQNTQMLFHRPTRSNEYAITLTLELDRIGYDDEKQKYVLDDEGIKARQKKCVQAIRNMFVDIEGALCSTRLPHLMNIEGILVDKADKNDVLVKCSALNDDYKEVNKRIATKSTEFNNIEEFVNVLDELI